MMADRLRQPDALSNTLAVAGNLALGRFGQADALQRLPGKAVRLAIVDSMQLEHVEDERISGDPFRERVELRAITDPAKQLFRLVRREAKNPDPSLGRTDQSGHQVHQRSFPRTIRTDQTGDSRRQGKVHAIDAEHIAVELRDVLERDAISRIGHSRFHKPTAKALNTEDTEVTEGNSNSCVSLDSEFPKSAFPVFPSVTSVSSVFNGFVSCTQCTSTTHHLTSFQSAVQQQQGRRAKANHHHP